MKCDKDYLFIPVRKEHYDCVVSRPISAQFPTFILEHFYFTYLVSHLHYHHTKIVLLIFKLHSYHTLHRDCKKTNKQ